MSIKANDIVVCSVCGTAGPAKRRGSGGIELLLWLFCLFPGVIYSIWRSGGGQCSGCGSTALIPANSPKAQQLSANPVTPETGKVIQAAIVHANEKKKSQTDSDARIMKFITVTIGVLVIFAMGPLVVGPEYSSFFILACLLAWFGFTQFKKVKAHKTSISVQSTEIKNDSHIE